MNLKKYNVFSSTQRKVVMCNEKFEIIEFDYNSKSYDTAYGKFHSIGTNKIELSILNISHSKMINRNVIRQ
jgi:hypothetical protein